MSLHIINKEVQNLIKQLGYQGCKNCQHQIEPLRMCEWAEQGGDGQIHFICPMWDKKESEEISDRNLKMWIEIFAEEKRREERK